VQRAPVTIIYCQFLIPSEYVTTVYKVTEHSDVPLQINSMVHIYLCKGGYGFAL